MDRNAVDVTCTECTTYYFLQILSRQITEMIYTLSSKENNGGKIITTNNKNDQSGNGVRNCDVTNNKDAAVDIVGQQW